MVVFNRPYSSHLVVKVPKGTKIAGATVLGGEELKVQEVARDEFHVDMPVQDPVTPFAIRLKVEEAGGHGERYRDALTLLL